ncbi:DUF2304 domain-containing protein [Luteimonas sp. gir]|uniref:DUF2304 domain-containing protein n=1 Tax=Luteimonas sp. gir TaxID=3127960 RepID=UPI003075B483
MIIRALLIVSTIWIAWYFLSSRGTSRSNAFKKVLLVGFVIAAVVAVLFPESLTAFAHLVGVGRGTDLLVYALAQVAAFQMFNTYAKDKDNQRQIVHLARRIAMLEAAMKKKPESETGSALENHIPPPGSLE